MKKLCKVQEMELKTYTSVDPILVFDKIKFKVLHYIRGKLIHELRVASQSSDIQVKSSNLRVTSLNPRVKRLKTGFGRLKV